MSARPRAALAFGSLALLAFLCFLPALGHDFVVTSDDWDYVVANPAVRAGLSADSVRWAFAPHAANWHPLTWLSHMADVQLYGLNPAGHHLTSLLLHAANAALLGLALFDLTGRAARSWLVAALFAVHPTRVESVAWVAERKDVLCALFWILATWAYVRGTRSDGRWRFAPALVLFALGLMAKPMIVTLPVLLLLLDAGPLSRVQSLRRDLPRLLVEKTPFVALSAVACVVTVLAQRAGLAVQSLDTFPLPVRLGNVPLACVSYLRAFAWPRDLSAYYVHPGPQIPWLASAAAATVLAVCTLLAMRSGRCYLKAGWLWFLITLLPVIGLVQVGEQGRADRYTYLPYVGLWAALVWGGAEVLERLPRPALAGTCAGGLLVVSLAVATRDELPHWRDARALYGRALELNPGNVFALQNRGVALLYAGDLSGALRDFDRVLQLRPEYHFALRAAGEASAQAGDPGAAAGYLERLRRATPDDPVAATRLGDARLADGDLPAALAAYATARRIGPAFTTAAYPYAVALLTDGQVGAGLDQLQIAAAGRPDRADWQVQLAGARQLAAGADGPERGELERALAGCHRLLAEGLRRRGRSAEASDHELEAARLLAR